MNRLTEWEDGFARRHPRAYRAIEIIGFYGFCAVSAVVLWVLEGSL